MLLQKSCHGGNMHHQRAFVVRDAAPVDDAVPYRGFEGMGAPFTQRVGGLDVIVPVNDDMGPRRVALAPADDNGVFRCLDDFHLATAMFAEQL